MIATDLESFYGIRYDDSLRLTSSVKGQLDAHQSAKVQ